MPVQPMILPSSVIRRIAYLELGGLPLELRTREDTLLFYKLGLLFAACAVNDCGAVITADGNARLTQEINSSSTLYAKSTIMVYEQVLALGDAINPQIREIMISRLSAAHFRFAKVFYRKKNI